MMKRIHFYLLITTGICLIALISSDFHLIAQSKRYDDAKTYCRDFYEDLATVHNLSDMNNLITLALNVTARAWIGLENGRVWMWHWSQPNQKLDYFNWRPGEPQNTSRDGCVAMDKHGQWFESDCADRRSFICQGIGGTGGYVFVGEAKSWGDAQIHCRNLLSDLVSVRSAEKNEAVLRALASQSVWIGLFKDPWKWSDGSPTSFRYWKPLQPNYLQGQDCVAAVVADQGKWNDLRCGTRRYFVCRGARKYMATTTTSPVSTQEPLRTTLNGPQNTTAGELSTNFTVSATVSQLTPNVTDGARSSPSTEVNNATTALLTTTQLPSQPAENLILIQENLSWIQAMSYCREHHLDLVHIVTWDVQAKVAAIAKNSTSPHVWIGLRYTCQFNFWFWANSAPGCYQNWAPGQGPQGDYECGVTGAVQATGGQQWVGLPDGERLNFICSACGG